MGHTTEQDAHFGRLLRRPYTIRTVHPALYTMGDLLGEGNSPKQSAPMLGGGNGSWGLNTGGATTLWLINHLRPRCKVYLSQAA
jgi:hypothetical protein